MQPLQGIRILDLTRMVAGAYCSMILADLGAEVIKVEQPGIGDDTRQWGPPFINGESAYFLSVNRNKQSLTLDLRKEKAQEIFRGLVKQADVVMENFRTGTMEKFNLGYPDLKKIRPDLVYCSITGFGLSGPYKNRPGTDPILQATGGLLGIIGEPDGKPYRIALPIIDMTSGLYAHGSILAALTARGRDGQSHFIEISLLDNELSLLINLGSNYLLTGEVPKRYGNAHPSIVPYNIFETKDRPVFISASADVRWKKLCQLLGLDNLIDDPRFRTTGARIQRRAEVEALLQERLREKTADEWMEMMDHSDAGVPFAPINSLDRVFNDPHVVAREIVTEVTHPATGRIKMVGMPVRYDGRRGDVRMPPPRLGEHNREILTRMLGYNDQAVDRLKEEGVI
jgi:crotonobetainyl-CoA:carnitine CoA-transferase CaiB-like acyl-CoA transferase